MARQVRKSGTPNEQPSIIIGSDDGANGSTGDVASVIADDAGNGLIIIDPGTIGSGGSDNGSSGDTAGDAPKRRGRKPGSTNTRSSTKATLDINGIEALLFSAHALLAGISKTPELMLDKDESKELAKGIANVSRHYDLTTTQKTMDIANLVMVCGMVYGSRLIAIRARKRNERDSAPAKPAPAQTTSGNTQMMNIPGVGMVAVDPTGALQ